MNTKEYFEINKLPNVVQKPDLGYSPPLLIMFGRDLNCCPIISFSQFPIEKAFNSSEVIEVLSKKLVTGFRYDIKLKDKSSAEIFYMLCDDLLTTALCEKERLKYAKKIVWRYKLWCKLLKRRKDGLSNEQKQGLFGELFYIIKKLDHGDDPDSLLKSWKGPEMAAQDFIEKGAWVEVKTVKQSATSIQISSLEQLDNPAGLSAEECKNVQGTLVIIKINKTTAGTTPFSLISLVDNIRKKLPEESEGLFIFERNLELLGYSQEKEKLENFSADIVDYQEYDANAIDFPKYRIKDVNPAIIGMRYDLSIAGISKWIKKIQEY